MNFDEVLGALKEGSIALIDVRNRSEIEESAAIQGATNIPLPEFENFLKKTPQEISNTVGIDIGGKGANLVVTCRSGRRAAVALETARKFGFDNVRIYPGSFNEWVEKGGPVVKT